MSKSAENPPGELAQAKALIQAKQYDEARRLLRTIDHPTAKVWLQKLNTVSPEPTRTAPALNIILVGLACLIVGLAAGVLIGRASVPPSEPLTIAAAPTAVALPTETNLPPTSTVLPTEDCGAKSWWNMNAGTVVDYMKMVRAVLKEPTDDPLYLSSAGKSLGATIDKFGDVSYPLCAKEAHDVLVQGMSNYLSAFYEMSFNAMGDDFDKKTPDDYLTEARAGMKEASRLLTGLTGMDTTFLTIETE